MKRAYIFSMLFLFVTVYFNEIFGLAENTYIILTTCGIILFLISSLSMTRGFQLYVSLISLTIGHILLFKYSLGLDIWYDSITKSMGIPVLFVAIPMISFPIKHGNYLEGFKSYVISRRERPLSLFSLLAVMHLALAIPLSIGSIPTMQKLLEELKLPKKYLVRLYTAGYCCYMVFSPYDALVNMLLVFAARSYSDYFLSGLVMAVTIILVTALFIHFDRRLLKELKSRLTSPDMIKNGEGTSQKKMYELMVHIIVLIFLAFLGDKLLPLSNQLYKIAVIIIVYSTIWGFILKILDKYGKELRNYGDYLLNYRNFLPFLLSASFLGSVLSHTPFKTYIGQLLQASGSLPLYFIIQFFMLLTMVLSLCGVHMLITVTTLALTVTPQMIGLSNIAFVLTLLSCWYVSMSITPFAPFAVILSETTREKILRITFKYNLKYSLVMLLIAPLIILLVNSF